MLPTTDEPIPSIGFSIGLFTTFGFVTVISSNVISDLPITYCPIRIVVGTLVGGFAGYAFHHGAIWAKERALKYRAALHAEYRRTYELMRERSLDGMSARSLRHRTADSNSEAEAALVYDEKQC